MSELSQFLTSSAVARCLGLSPSTLRKWRAERRGPQFVRLGDRRAGRVLYRVTDVEEWIQRETTAGGAKADSPEDGGPLA